MLCGISDDCDDNHSDKQLAPAELFSHRMKRMDKVFRYVGDDNG